MPATTTALATETIFAKWVTSRIIDFMYSIEIYDPLVFQESIADLPTNAYSFPAWPGLTAASIGETTDLVSTGVDTTQVTITAAEGAAIRIDVTDLLAGASVVRNPEQFAEQGARAVNDLRDADGWGNNASFTTNTQLGTTNVNITEATILKAITVLRAADAPQPYVYATHPHHVGQLRSALSQTTAAVQTNTPPNSLSVGDMNGFEFSYYGLPIYSTTNMLAANGTTDWLGVIFSKGQALARVNKRMVRVMPQRDESLRATEFNITSVYGQGILVNGWGVGIIGKQGAL